MNGGDMQIGETFATRGYDVVASAQFAEEGGEAVLLNNNSTHFLVAIRQGDADEQAQLIASYRYYDEHAPAYRRALRRMTEAACAR